MTQPCFFEAMERRVERAVYDKKLIVRDRLDPLGHGIAMAGTPGERLQDQEIKRAAEQSTVAIEHRRCAPSVLEGNLLQPRHECKRTAVRQRVVEKRLIAPRVVNDTPQRTLRYVS